MKIRGPIYFVLSLGLIVSGLNVSFANSNFINSNNENPAVTQVTLKRNLVIKKKNNHLKELFSREHELANVYLDYLYPYFGALGSFDSQLSQFSDHAASPAAQFSLAAQFSGHAESKFSTIPLLQASISRIPTGFSLDKPADLSESSRPQSLTYLAESLGQDENTAATKILGHSGAVLELMGESSNQYESVNCKADIGSSHALSVGADGQVLRWELGAVPEATKIRTLNPVPDLVALSSKGGLAVIKGRNLSVFNPVLESAQAQSYHKELATRALALGFSPDGLGVLIGGADGKVYLWRLPERVGEAKQPLKSEFERYSGHGSTVSALAFHWPLGNVFFSGDWRGNINVWSQYERTPWDDNRKYFGDRFFSAEATRVRAGKDGGEAIERLISSPKGDFILAGLGDGALELWQVRGFKKNGSVKAHTGLIQDIAVSPCGKRVASIGRDGLLKVWEVSLTEKLETKAFNPVYEKAMPEVSQIVFRNEIQMLVGTKEGQVNVVELEK